MPDEPIPPHPLEAALRAQAERRRGELDAGRPPELPGPVRAALRRELERGATPARAERARSAPWWWRWQTVLATAACVLLAVGVFRHGTGPLPSNSDQTAAPPPPPGAAADRRDGPAPAEEQRAREVAPAPEPTTPRDADVAVAAPAPPAAPILPPAGGVGGSVAERSAPAVADEPPAAPPALRLEQPKAASQPIAAAPGAPADAILGRAAKPTPGAAGASQRFLQTPRQQTLRSAQSVGASPVLTDFTLRREGNTLVIRESDGSEYRAPIADAKREAGSTDAFKKDASRRGLAANRAESDDRAVTFRATGVNQTLKQTVVIEGTFRPAGAEEPRDAVPAARPRAAAAPAPAKVKEAESRAAGPGRASVQGRAIISEREYAVEAEEAGPAPAAR